MTLKNRCKSPANCYFCSILFNATLFFLLSVNTLFAANNQHSHDDIRSSAVEFVRLQIPDDITIRQIKAGKIDPRIHFKQWSQALEARSALKKSISKSWTIGIRCHDDPPWNIYIPVKAELTRKMLVSTTTITRGEVITANKIKLQEQAISHQNQKHFSDPANIIGREARKTIRPNQVFNSTMLQQAFLVRKKEAVLIYAKNQNLSISMQGTALKNGRYNEMIQVRNNSSKKIIEALVVERGVVAVNF